MGRQLRPTGTAGTTARMCAQVHRPACEPCCATCRLPCRPLDHNPPTALTRAVGGAAPKLRQQQHQALGDQAALLQVHRRAEHLGREEGGANVRRQAAGCRPAT